jgi:hypothetical protein
LQNNAALANAGSQSVDSTRPARAGALGPDVAPTRRRW